MKIKNVSPVGDLDLPLLGRTVAKGEVFEVAAEVGALLLEQPAHWKEHKTVTPKPKPASKPPVKEGESK